MPAMTIRLDGEKAWEDLRDKQDSIIHLAEGHTIQVVALDGGMKSGHPSVAFRFDLPDGRVVIAETSARLFCSAARGIMGRWPNLFDDAPPKH